MEICGIKAELLDPMSGSGCLNYLNRDFNMYVLAPFLGKNNSENKKEIYLKLPHLTLERQEQYHDTSKSMTQATFYQTCQKLFLWSKVAFLDQNVGHGLEHSSQSTFYPNMLIKALSLTSYCFFQHVYCIICIM